MPIEIVLILLAAACVAAALIAMGRERKPRSWARNAPDDARNSDLPGGGTCRPKRPRTAVWNAAIFGIFGVAFVVGVHFVEGRSTRDTIQQMLDKEFPGKAFAVEELSFPASYSAPFLARMDLTPPRVRGSFRLSRPAGQKGCVGESFAFELQPRSLNFLISIPEPELARLRLCLSL